MNENGGRGNEALIGFLLGAVVGAGAALLMAPATGEETRRRIGEGARDLANNTRDRFNRVKERVGEVSHNLGERLERERQDLGRAMGETHQGTP